MTLIGTVDICPAWASSTAFLAAAAFAARSWACFWVSSLARRTRKDSPQGFRGETQSRLSSFRTFLNIPDFWSLVIQFQNSLFVWFQNVSNVVLSGKKDHGREQKHWKSKPCCIAPHLWERLVLSDLGVLRDFSSCQCLFQGLCFRSLGYPKMQNLWISLSRNSNVCCYTSLYRYLLCRFWSRTWKIASSHSAPPLCH